MPTTSHDARLTYHDFVLLPGDGRRHEIIGGVHYVTPSPNLGHQELVLRLALAVGHHLEDRPDRGRLFVAQAPALRAVRRAGILGGRFRHGQRDDFEAPPRWFVPNAVTADGQRARHAQNATAARLVPGTRAPVPLVHARASEARLTDLPGELSDQGGGFDRASGRAQRGADAGGLIAKPRFRQESPDGQPKPLG